MGRATGPVPFCRGRVIFGGRQERVVKFGVFAVKLGKVPGNALLALVLPLWYNRNRTVRRSVMPMLAIGLCDDNYDARLALRAALERLLETQGQRARLLEFSSGEGCWAGWTSIPVSST